MSIEPEESMAPNVRATLPEASERADAAWVELQELGSSFGTHPLSDILEGATPDVAARHDDVA